MWVLHPYTKPIAGKAALKPLIHGGTEESRVNTKPIAGKAALKQCTRFHGKHNCNAYTKPIAGKAALKLDLP